MSKVLIKGGTIVNEGRSFQGDLLIDGEVISDIFEGMAPRGIYDEVVDATGCFILPGVIDAHVHFREPGLTRKADIESESRAAAYGGVTSYMEMPNTVPQTTELQAWNDKRKLGAEKSHVNYSFFYGATNDNVDSFAQLDMHHVPGIKLFMGSSTGNMLVDKMESLKRVFKTAKDLNLPVMTHCEDTGIINRNMAEAKAKYGEDPAVEHHPEIRSEEACYESSKLAVELAREFGTRLHIAHVTTARELELFAHQNGKANEHSGDGIPLPQITGEAVIAHLVFSDADYATKKALIKCNPAIKTLADRDALRKALSDGTIATIGTDHAPHEWKDKQGGCAKAASGMPMVQFSLVSMLELVDEGVLTIERMVELMAHQPAQLFRVAQRGFLRKGYQADIVIVKPHSPWTVTKDVIQSKCKWSPMEGHEYQWQVEQTFCNGHLIYNKEKGGKHAECLKGVGPYQCLDASLACIEPDEHHHRWHGEPEGNTDVVEHEMLQDEAHHKEAHGCSCHLRQKEEGSSRLVGTVAQPVEQIGIDGGEVVPIIYRQQDESHQEVTHDEA